MADLENTIKGLEKVWNAFNTMEHELYADYVFDALELLKELKILTTNGLLPISANVSLPKDNKDYYVIAKNNGVYDIYIACYEDGQWGYWKEYFGGEGELMGSLGREWYEIEDVVYWFNLSYDTNNGREGKA